MADEIDELPRGVAVSRRHATPPWQVDTGERPCLHVVVDGAFHLARGEARALELAPGDLVLVTAEHSLRCVALPGGPQAELVSATFAASGELAALGPVVHIPAARRSSGLAAVVDLLRTALAEPAQPELARSLLAPLLAYSLHSLRRADRPARAVDRRIARALQLMQARPGEDWTVAGLARAAGLSRAAFARRFLAELGVPPLRWLTDLRMQRAARRLADGDDSLAAIAAEVGYDSEFAFSRAFKRHTGEAPGAFRRRVRAEVAHGGALACAA